MRRIIVMIICLVSVINGITAQDETMLVQGTSPNLYINYTLVAKDNYYSIGRLYNVPPREIAAYNNLVFESGLRLGQVVKIPLTQGNLSQAPDASAGATKPVYHVVGAKEGLYRISVNYNKVPLEQLKKWNHLSSDAVSSGTKLIVGYLKGQDETAVKNLPAAKNEVVESTKEEQPAPKKPEVVKDPAPEVKKEDLKTPEVVASNPPVKEDVPDAKNISVSHTTINFDGGAFKKLYGDQQPGKTPVTETGISGVFKSTSGWKDGKYYCFNSTAPTGTIIKITNNANGKSVYAKVLDLIPDIAQNTGLILHISNAAAEELGVNDTKFNCSINYSK